MEEDLADDPRPGAPIGPSPTASRCSTSTTSSSTTTTTAISPGDEALRQVARCLDRATRAGESVYRYGGEEFLLLMHRLHRLRRVEPAERIRAAVTELVDPPRGRPEPPFVTLSGGVAVWDPGSPRTVAELLERADQALFEAKSAGRNCIRSANEPATVG